MKNPISSRSILPLAAVGASLLLAIPEQSHAGLVGHWEFDNSGDVGQATVSSSLEAVGDAAYSASGKVGGALALDGAGDYLRVDASHTLPSGLPTGDSSYTVAAFIQTTQTGRQSIVTWGNNANAQTNSLRTTTVGEAGIGNNGTPGVLNYNWGGAANGDYGQGSGTNLYDGTWYHVAATYDSATSTKRLYLDGVELGTGLVVTNNLNVQGSNFRIGNAIFDSELFNGLIDDVRVYDNALSQSEISALASIPEPSAVALLGLGGLALLIRRRK